MELLDLRRQYADLYKPNTKVPSVVNVPPLRFLMLEGTGGAGCPEFEESVSALFGLAYPVKFAAKKELEIAYRVPPLEGMFWDAEEGEPAEPRSSDTMAWRLMIMLPGQVDGDLVDRTRERVATKKRIARLDDIRVQTFSEGVSVQVMHVGPYSAEQATVKKLRTFASDKGLEIIGAHHEIYVSDPNKSVPERLKTVVRYAVGKRR